MIFSVVKEHLFPYITQISCILPYIFNFLEMDAQKMSFADESFDYIVASLILSMVPNENKCFEEMIRVLKKDGRILIFDKFAPKNQKVTLTKKIGKAIYKYVRNRYWSNF